jgi:translocation and assembly module TamB
LTCTLLVALWFWIESDTSLATAIQQSSRFLPAGQSLVAKDVRGSVRNGGHIGVLRWEKNGLVVEASEVELAWEPVALFSRRLQLDRLNIRRLTIDDKSPPTGAAPT